MSINDKVSIEAGATMWMLIYELARIGLDHREESEHTSFLTEKGIAGIHEAMEAIADGAMPVIFQAIEEHKVV